MKIFVAYGFNQRDSWIPRLVFPIIEAFGDEVVTGEDEQGEDITEETTNRIKSSDALIAFTTRRVDAGQPAAGAEGQQAGAVAQGFLTHRWVTDELAVVMGLKAAGFTMAVVEVTEDEDPEGQRGVAGKDRQVIRYKEGARDRCLVEIVKTIGRWHKRNHVTLTLLPDECVQQLGPKVKNNPNLRCYYKFLVGFEESEEVKTKSIYTTKGGIMVQIKDVPREAKIQLKVECDGETWLSNYESADSYGIYLEKV